MKQRQLILFGIVAVALIAVGVVVFLLSRPPAAAPVLGIEEIQAQMDAGDYAAARRSLLAYLEVNEADAEAHFMLGLAHFNLAEYEQAQTHFLRSADLDPGRASAVHHNCLL